MKIPSIFRNDIQKNRNQDYLSGKEFQEALLRQNIRRGKLLALIVITFEVVFLLIDLVSSFLKVNDSFAFNAYLVMYSTMILLNLVYLLLVHRFDQKRISVKMMNAFITVYITIMMTWGSVLSLMDQKLYPQLMAFMVNVVVSSVIYLLESKRMGIPYLISTLVLVIGLPFFQHSGDILFGHYVNLLVFIVVFFIASRMIYNNYRDNYMITKRMNQSETLLKKEMEEKRIINEKLAIANEQLKKIALIDELTKLPNRRSFRGFIDKAYQHRGNALLTASVIMIDIDYFKQFNDYYGHEKGDLALVVVASQIASLVEGKDQIAVRWGGEEFIYFAFNKTRESILTTANMLRMKIRDLKIPNPNSSICPYITASLGTCSAAAVSKDGINRLIKIADEAMYQAKKSGRNCVAALRDTQQADEETR